MAQNTHIHGQLDNDEGKGPSAQPHNMPRTSNLSMHDHFRSFLRHLPEGSPIQMVSQQFRCEMDALMHFAPRTYGDVSVSGQDLPYGFHPSRFGTTNSNRHSLSHSGPHLRDFRRNMHQIGRSFVLSTTGLLQNAAKGEVDLKRSAGIQQFLLAAVAKNGFEAAFLKELGKMQKLAPTPEIFWEVDRNADDFTQRFGFDIHEALDAFATSEKQVLLEMGPGSGALRAERPNKVREQYLDLALCDKLYWPMAPLLRQMINFAKLEAETGSLSEEEKNILCDFIYKILVIKQGQASNDTFEKDVEVLDSLAEDPNSIYSLLKLKLPLLATTNVVPGSGEATDDGIRYERKVSKPDSEPFRKVCECLSDPSAVDTYVNKVRDVYTLLPAYAPGTLIADFQDIDRLKDSQVDVALSMRGTVYKVGAEYRSFVKDMIRILAKDGICLDDSVRRNFGREYSLPDLKIVQDETAFPIHIILGPGIPGEDFQKDRPVPLSIVITKSDTKLAYIRSQLQPGYSLVDLDSLFP